MPLICVLQKMLAVKQGQFPHFLDVSHRYVLQQPLDTFHPIRSASPDAIPTYHSTMHPCTVVTGDMCKVWGVDCPAPQPHFFTTNGAEISVPLTETVTSAVPASTKAFCSSPPALPRPGAVDFWVCGRFPAGQKSSPIPSSILQRCKKVKNYFVFENGRSAEHTERPRNGGVENTMLCSFFSHLQRTVKIDIVSE